MCLAVPKKEGIFQKLASMGDEVEAWLVAADQWAAMVHPPTMLGRDRVATLLRPLGIRVAIQYEQYGTDGVQKS